MNTIFEFTLQHRKNLQHILETTPRAQLFEIPEGYNNNIWWNIAHLVVTQQLLAYGLSGKDMRVPEELVANYRKGTAPHGNVTDATMQTVARLLTDTIIWTREDYEKGLLATFKPYTTSAKITLNSIEEALTFNFYHEGLHMGTILALRKLVSTEI